MDDSFRVRVDKVFGSLAAAAVAPPSSSSRPLWSLSDEEVEKKEWNRPPRDNPDRDDDTPSSSSFDGFFSNRKIPTTTEGEDENEEIRSSIGLDPTLDHEEEEDEHDQVALGKENVSDRLYMKDVTDYGTYLNSHNILPEIFKDHDGDSRENHYAAKFRLEEDEDVSGTLGLIADGDNELPAVMDTSVTGDGWKLKSILKRKENQADKPTKRVRFDPACQETCEEDSKSGQNSMIVNCSVETNTCAEDTSLPPRNTRGVPDYVRNPSKYTRYSFDSSSEVDENSNSQAYTDLVNTINGSRGADSQLEAGSEDLPKSVTFIPKKKAVATAVKEVVSNMKQRHDKEPKHRAGFAPGIAAAEVQENEVCAMEEDDLEMTTGNRSGSSHKTGRKYRSKVQEDDSVEGLSFECAFLS